MEKLFDIGNREHRKYLMEHSDEIRGKKLDFFSYISLKTTSPDTDRCSYNLYKDKMVREYGDDFIVYFDDNTSAEYGISYVGHLSKLAPERFQLSEDTPFDGVFAIRGGQLFTEKHTAEKRLFYTYDYDRLSWHYDIIPMLYGFVHATKSIKTFCKTLDGQGISISDDEIKGRVITRYLPLEKKYSVRIISSADIDDHLGEILKEFNINKINSEIITETMQIQICE